jgi:hypothetical protein
LDEDSNELAILLFDRMPVEESAYKKVLRENIRVTDPFTGDAATMNNISVFVLFSWILSNYRVRILKYSYIVNHSKIRCFHDSGHQRVLNQREEGYIIDSCKNVIIAVLL